MTTYRELYNNALSKIKSVCKNVSNYGSLPSQMKSGYSQGVTSTQGGNYPQRPYAYLKISNVVPQVTTDTVDSQFSTHISNCGFSSILDTNTTARGEVLFMRAVGEFCAAKIYTAQSRNSGRFVCYNPDSTPTVSAYNSTLNISTADANILDVISKNASTSTIVHNFTW